MKYYKKKTAKFLNGAGFYIVMAVCMIAVGFAAYSAMDAARMNNNSGDTSYNENSEENNSQDIVLEPVSPQEDILPTTEQENTHEQTSEVDTKTEEPYFTPPLKNYEISKEYSKDTLQYSATYNDMRLHTGIDLVPFESLVVYSCSSGTVASIDTGTVMGDVITVEHENNIFIRYCGVKNIKVKVGDTVNADTPIAEVGTVTGECAEQAHLHLEVIENSETIDPLSIIF